MRLDLKDHRYFPFLIYHLCVYHIVFKLKLFMPYFEEGGTYCFAHVGRSVSLNLVQLITQERFDPEASNLVGRYSLLSR